MGDAAAKTATKELGRYCSTHTMAPVPIPKSRSPDTIAGFTSFQTKSLSPLRAQLKSNREPATKKRINAIIKAGICWMATLIKK
jgi:hypothetical protein